ncbi:MAG: hypothetical protein IIZ44_02210 [Muribaculaceae bacterium]|nr:hypothetical protein [Muribaculaceae bacterium]
MYKFIDLDTGLPALLNKVKTWVTSKLTDKQDALVSGTNIKTINSTSLLGSGDISIQDGVVPHIGTNGNWWVGDENDANNDTGIKAQGTKGDTIVGSSTTIVNNVTDGGETSALSAEMGKVLRINIMAIYNALGAYAFPDGKPTLNWGSTVVKHSITASLTSLTAGSISVNGTSAESLPVQITDNQSLSLTLNPSSNLYVIDDDNLVITMGGTDIKSTAYNSSTGVISIAAVTGDVVISAVGMTYVGYGEQNSPLVLMFDGINRGGTAGSWQDLANTSRSLALTGGYTENTDNVQFDGTGYGVGNFVDSVVYNQSTTECVIKQTTAVTSGFNQVILLPGKTGAPILGIFYASSYSRAIWVTNAVASGDSYTATRSLYSYAGDTNTKYSFSYYGNTMRRNGSTLSPYLTNVDHGDAFNVANHKDKTFVGAQVTGSNAVLGFRGQIYCVRMYNRVLTDAEALHNWKVDKKRFNIS